MPILLDYPLAHVALITIDNQPKRNAMSREMMAELVAYWDQLESSASRASVLCGAGVKAFTGSQMGNLSVRRRDGKTCQSDWLCARNEAAIDGRDDRCRNGATNRPHQ
jgi:enoyl-CoA hydratase/carnithine racemase